MVPLLGVYALVVPLKVRLAYKFFGAVRDLAGERVFTLLVVRLHVRLEVVAAAEEFAASLDHTLEVGFLLGCVPPGRPAFGLFHVGPGMSARLWKRRRRANLRSHKLKMFGCMRLDAGRHRRLGLGWRLHIGPRQIRLSAGAELRLVWVVAEH